MKPRSELLALNQGPDRTMPWASLARSHLAPNRRRIDGDVGFEKNDDSPNAASMTQLPGEVLLVRPCFAVRLNAARTYSDRSRPTSACLSRQRNTS